MIELKDAVKIYDKSAVKVTALDGLSLTVEEGDFLAVMGTSGSGKSTLLNILGGMDTLTSGEYLFDGKHIEKYNQKQLDRFRKENIAFVFQNFALMHSYSVYENLEMPLQTKKYTKQERREIIEKSMEQLGIAELKKKLPGELSGGQQQRCAIARALVMDSRIILADEPTGALDTKNSENIMELFTSINEMGKTILVITHDKQIAGYCKKTLQLEDGHF